LSKEIITRFGVTELIILLVVVVLFFGTGRIEKIAGEVGSDIRKFREGIKGDGKIRRA
jgi:sec-independent protein translocase protein TatA